MLTTIRQFANRHGRQALTWTLAGLAVFAGLPRAACLCADGGVKQFCPILANVVATAKVPAKCCQPALCEPETAATPNCCRNKQTSEKPSPAGASGKSCCRPTVLAAAPAAKAGDESAIGQVAQSDSPANIPPYFLTSATSDRHLQVEEAGSGPPVFDRVIVLLRLTI
ncbi:MAG: hypothetical protein SFU86_12105 [Pirellulaceae bacterium]|nr:hypothetical protein [Pirellulaceae bacterium]